MFYEVQCVSQFLVHIDINYTPPVYKPTPPSFGGNAFLYEYIPACVTPVCPAATLHRVLLFDTNNIDDV